MKKVGYSTMDEIVDALLETLSLDFREKAREMTADEFRISQHFNLGMLIRKKYFYHNKSREQLVKRLGNKKDYMFLDGDVFSRIVLEALYRKITTENK